MREARDDNVELTQGCEDVEHPIYKEHFCAPHTQPDTERTGAREARRKNARAVEAELRRHRGAAGLRRCARSVARFAVT